MELVLENNFEVEVCMFILGLYIVGYIYDVFFVSDGRLCKNVFGILIKL